MGRRGDRDLRRRADGDVGTAGGNAPMVDALVAAWNQVYPDCEIT